jgi:hypothetical protein
MSEPAPLYLVAHKVRGEVAFDIALQCTCPECNAAGCLECDGLGYWWIVPTSGHRAYPYWYYQLKGLVAYTNVGQPPDGLPDHYQTSAAPAPARPTGLAAMLAAARSANAPTINRRGL